MNRQRRYGVSAVVDKTVLITGAAAGIGAELARAAATAGARVLAIDVDAAGLDRLIASLPGARHHAAVADVRDLDSLDDAVREGVERLGSVTMAFANAGVTPPTATMSGIDPETFRRVIDINVLGVLHTYRATAEDLKATGGHLHITGSCSAFMPGPGGAAYMVSKAGVEQLARALRFETAHTGMTVGITLLGMIDTGLASATLDDDPFGRGLDAMLPGILSRRVDPARTANFLLRQAMRRTPRRVYPRAWAPLQAMRGFLPATDALLSRDRRLAELLADLETRSRQSATKTTPERARLGAPRTT